MKATNGNIKDLTPDNRNANRHKERGKGLLQKSLHELGAGRSVLADANGVLIAGNNTVETAIAEGITKTIVVETTGNELVVVKRTDLDLNDPGEAGRKARQMALVDNAAALEGIEWDNETVEEIENEWGFEAQEWGVELPQEEVVAPPVEEDEGAGALPKHAVTVKGDIWELVSEGKKLRHRVMCGDSTSVDDWDTLSEKVPANLLITDPPYGVAYVGKTQDSLTIQNDALTAEQTHQLWNDALTAALLNLKDGAGIYATVPAGLLQVGFMQVMVEHECLRQCMVWDKGQMVLGHSDYHYAHEPILYGWKPGASHYFTSDRTKTTVFRYAKPIRNDMHPTMKPVELWAEMISNSSNVGDIVIDTFSGSGTTVVACEQLKRHSRCMELDEKYCDVIVRRWIAQMEKDGAKWKVLLNGEERPEMVSRLLEQN